MSASGRHFLWFVFSFLSLAPAVGHADPPDPWRIPAEPGRVEEAELWILAGQSNMAGNGILPETPAAGDPDLLLYNMDDQWLVAQEPTHRIFEANAPIHRDIMLNIDKMTPKAIDERRELSRRPGQRPLGGKSPGLAFARELKRGLDKPIGLIACAHGGTTMRQWDPALGEQGGASLYGALLERVRRIGRPVAGVLWYQGESEGMEPADAPAYCEQLLRLVDALRRDLNQPDLPFLYVQIGRWVIDDARGPSWEIVREQQRAAMRKRPRMAMVPALDLTLDDQIHLSAEGNERLGGRLAEVALAEFYGRPGHAGPIELEAMEALDVASDRPVIRVSYRGVVGKLRACDRADGFALLALADSPGRPSIYRVDLDEKDPHSLLLRVRGPLPKGSRVVCGPGLNPHVDIHDDRDMPIPAFGPLEVTVGP